MAITRTVLPRKGFVQPQHGLTGYEQDMDGNMSLLDANVVFASDIVLEPTRPSSFSLGAYQCLVLAGTLYLVSGVTLTFSDPTAKLALI